MLTYHSCMQEANTKPDSHFRELRCCSLIGLYEVRALSLCNNSITCHREFDLSEDHRRKTENCLLVAGVMRKGNREHKLSIPTWWMERKPHQAIVYSLNQRDHGFMCRMVPEEMSFGSLSELELPHYHDSFLIPLSHLLKPELSITCPEECRYLIPFLTAAAFHIGLTFRMDLSTWENMANGRVEEFILLGFTGTWHFRVSLVVVFALMYSLTITGNASIIALLWTNRSLHTPMYFFLCNLSFLEIWCTTGIVPKAIGVMIGSSQTISFSVCILQLFLILSLGSTECFLLSVMAYDRYALCYPLRYSFLMSNVHSAQLALRSWLGGFLAIPLLAILTSRLTFCGPDVINYYLYDIDFCLALSCSGTWTVELATFLVSIIVVVASCVVTLVSYIYIISSILRIQSAHGRKTFSTCSADLSVVTIWYGSTVFLYVKPSAQKSLDLIKFVNTFNTVVTPLLNPFIYTLRNKEVKALGRAFQKK
ncbi:LOW QUALITY PROTEIN: olfactory receptor 6F1-like [Rhynochetos jubatus]